jgi:hypothetical protein
VPAGCGCRDGRPGMPQHAWLSAQVISTGGPVLPGARGRVSVSRSAESTLFYAQPPASQRWSSRFADPSEQRRCRQGTGTFPSPVGDRVHPAARRRPPRRLGEAHRVVPPCSGSRASPVLDLAAGPVRGVICKTRRFPEGNNGSRRHAALGLLDSQVRNRQDPTAFAKPAQGRPHAMTPGPPRRRRPEGRLRTGPPGARDAPECGVQRFVTGELPGSFPHRFAVLRLAPALSSGRPRCSPTRVSPLAKERDR